MDEILTERSGKILTITLNRPERLNAFTAATMRALSDACTRASDSAIRAVILTGNGRGFCAGPDLSVPKLDMEPGSRRLRRFYNPAIVELATLSKPVIAAVNGPVAGGGLSLAFAADIRIASDRARFVPGFADMGLAPDTGTSYFLVRLIGYSRALHFLASGEPLLAKQALAIGAVNEVVDHACLMVRAHEVAEQFAGKPGIAVGATKALLWDSARSSLLEQLEAEAKTYDVASINEERLAARAAMVRRIKGSQ